MKDPHDRPAPDATASREPDDGTQIHRAWSDLQRLADTLGRAEFIEPLRPAVERFEVGTFRLVIMGEIKKGKSSFLNALLGEPELLPTSSDVATSTVFQVRYGPEKKVEVFFLPDLDTGKPAPSLLIHPDEVAVYGTEDGNPSNRKHVDYIGIELPHPLLREGLILVDTPGVGGLFRAHRDITWRYAPNADAIFFILDSVEAVLSADEIRFLQELTAKVTRRVDFVQTKIDVVDEEQSRSWQERNLTILEEKLDWPQQKMHYFPVSSQLKTLADRRQSARHREASGFPEVLDFLHRDLMQAKRHLLAADLARKLQGLSQVLGQNIFQQRQIADASSMRIWTA